MSLEPAFVSAADFDPSDVVKDTRTIDIPEHVLSQIALDYSLELDKSEAGAGEALRQRIHEDESYRTAVYKAVWDAVVFSTYSNTVEIQVFEEALDIVKPIDDEVLQRMRQFLFDYGLSVTAASVGGSTTTGRLHERAKAFLAATQD